MDPSNNIQELKRKLEKEGEEKLKKLYNNNKHLGKVQVVVEKIDDIVKIMKDGEEKFLQSTGRHMTYNEIRELYG